MVARAPRLWARRARRRTSRSRVTRSSRWVSASRACQRASSAWVCDKREDMTATAREVARSRRPRRAAAEASWRSTPFWRLVWLRSAPGSWAAARCETPTAVGSAMSRMTATIVTGWRVGNVRRRMRTTAQTVGGPVERGTLALPRHRALLARLPAGYERTPWTCGRSGFLPAGPGAAPGAPGEPRPPDRALLRHQPVLPEGGRQRGPLRRPPHKRSQRRRQQRHRRPPPGIPRPRPSRPRALALRALQVRRRGRQRPAIAQLELAQQRGHVAL